MSNNQEPSSGGSLDWAKGKIYIFINLIFYKMKVWKWRFKLKAVAGIKYSVCLELRPGNTGADSSYGFLLPEDRVPLVGQETYVGLIAMINAIKNT